MATYGVKERLIEKDTAHNILMKKIKSVYKDDKLNMNELSRLTDIGYSRLRRLIFEDATWSVGEWFRVIIVCGCDGAISQMHKNTKKELSKYQKSHKYKKRAPKKTGPKPPQPGNKVDISIGY